jgi:hypothetical protein
MEYTKPTVERIALAEDAIQGSSKSALPQIDGGNFVKTPQAYEADE